MTLQEQIDALEAALAQGVKKAVFHDGGTRREVEYHSLKDMRQHLATLKGRNEPRSNLVLAIL